MFEINDVQLLIYTRTEPPTIGPMYVPSTTLPYTAPSTTTSQNRKGKYEIIISLIIFIHKLLIINNNYYLTKAIMIITKTLLK